jgi:ceramide glucosyltransferase
VGSTIQGSNNKVRILHELAAHATGEILVLTDADTRTTSDFLRRLVAPFEDQSVGLVSCFYRGANARSLADALGGLYMTCIFEPGAACAEALGKVDFALGAAIAIRRSVLDQIGGFESLVDYLADDFQIGHKTAALGHRVILSEYVIEIALPGEDLATVLGRELRWCRISGISRPMGHLGLVFTYGFAWAVFYWLASGLSVAGWAVLAGVAALRAVTAWTCARCLGDREFLHRIQLLPMRDLLAFGVWVAGFFSREVTWRGRRLRISADGKMEPV